ncbi:MAG: hypothetical protein ABJ327_02240 [Litoreibacter sp.]
MTFSKVELYQFVLWAGFAAIWAGVSLAGNLVAAPAKFQVEALDTPLALQIGRAQFTWIGYVEWGLLIAMAAVFTVHLRYPPTLMSVGIALFMFQQFWLQPMLRVRSDLIIAGESVAPSQLHLIFAGVEFAKFLCLAVFAALSLISVVKTVSEANPG